MPRLWPGCLLLAVFGGCATVYAGDLSFLEKGKDYHIRFPDDANPFRVSGESPTNYTIGNETRSTVARYSYSVTTFTVLEVTDGPWVLLKHPAKTDDYPAWNAYLQAKAQLTDENIAALEAKEELHETLKHMRERAANREIATAQSWVNLGVALAIQEVPSTIAGLPKSCETAKSSEPRAGITREAH